MSRLALIIGAIIALTVMPAKAAPHLTIDLDSGRILSHKQAFDPWHPASLTKLMTAYVAFKAIESGEVTHNHPVRISKTARKQPPSRMGYRVGTAMTLENAIKLILIKSANDVSVAIAESLGGTETGFANRMNREAAKLGMTGSNFVNAHGLHNPRQIVTARDMALLVQALHKRYPQYKAWFSTPSVLAPSRTKNGKIIKRIYYSYNLLLERYRGADGFKTGFVCASGYNFIGAATRSGRRIAAIVMGRDGQTSRAVDAARLITKGFELPLNAGTPLSEFKPGPNRATTPRNMRPVICTPEARAARYEPGAGQAVIKSPWLLERTVGAKPLVVKLGIPGRGGTTMARILRIPTPTFRPKTSSTIASLIKPSISTVEAKPKEKQNIDPAPVAKVEQITKPQKATKRTIPVPRFRPSS